MNTSLVTFSRHWRYSFVTSVSNIRSRRSNRYPKDFSQSIVVIRLYPLLEVSLELYTLVPLPLLSIFIYLFIHPLLLTKFFHRVHLGSQVRLPDNIVPCTFFIRPSVSCSSRHQISRREERWVLLFIVWLIHAYGDLFLLQISYRIIVCNSFIECFYLKVAECFWCPASLLWTFITISFGIHVQCFSANTSSSSPICGFSLQQEATILLVLSLHVFLQLSRSFPFLLQTQFLFVLLGMEISWIW